MRNFIKIICVYLLCAVFCCTNGKQVKVGIVFTGQGVPFTGIIEEFVEQYPEVCDQWNKIKDLTGLTDSDMFQQGNEKLLSDQGKNQIGLSAAQCLVYKAIQCECPNLHVDCVIGQSLGNYTALFVAGVIDLDGLFKFVKFRNELSVKFVKNSTQPYGMLVVRGVDFNTLNSYIDNKTVFVAGMNTDSLFTVSGLLKEIYSLKDRLQEDMPGVELTPLNVSVPFHTRLLSNLVKPLNEQFPSRQNPKIDVISDAGDISDVTWLEKQLTTPMHWSGSGGVLERIKNRALTHLVVVGAGEGFARDILEGNVSKGTKIFVVRSMTQLRALRAELDAFEKVDQ